MTTFNESILDETKKTLGISQDVTVYDTDIRMHINSAIGILSQLGIGPEEGYEVETSAETWADLLSTDLNLSAAKTFVYLQVRLLFDPPANSWTTVAIKEQLEELKWRLNVVREDTIPIEETPLPDEDLQWALDGGVI